MKMFPQLTCLLAVLTVTAAFRAEAQSSDNIVTIDASAPAPAPQPVAAALGSARSPSGQVIGVNSQYLTLDGKPWLPVMGEFHFSRYPEDEWEQEILKMKAAGVQIISTYVIWIHHEETEGNFDWSGQRDLRHFVELCGKHGMYVYPRIGPWAHAEVRNGGFPDWVVRNSPVRQNDPVYLKEVRSFYDQIAIQLHGLLWKDGGPVIGIQIENEYREHGPGKGDDHIRKLKSMAIQAGFDVPLYTVTGWDGAAIPLDAVLPVFGGYPDAPWDGSPRKLPPNDVYAFRFDNRSAGSMGAIGGHGQSAASTYRGTPFLTAEVGDGIEDTYFRRPVVSADDIADIPVVMLGSGANLLGYYMFHGGRNPDGGAITLQESQLTGYPTDVPVRSYDFQAPIGEFGQERESLRKLKLVHYFLSDFGSILAPMSPRPPAQMPTNPSDLKMARVAARVNGDSGFVFLSNYVRGADMPARPGFQIHLKMASQSVNIPEAAIDLPPNTYGIWPVNLQLPGALLRYSTAQLFKRVQVHDQTYFFFFAIQGVRPEFAFDASTRIGGSKGPAEIAQESHVLRVLMSSAAVTEVRLGGGVHLVLLPEAQAEDVWRVDDPALLLAANAEAFSDGSLWTLESNAQNRFRFGVFGAHDQPSSQGTALHRLSGARPSEPGLFQWYAASVPEVTLKPTVSAIRAAGPRPPWKFGASFPWRPNPSPLAPDDRDFQQAATWKISVPALPVSPTVSDAFLQLDWQGDVARLDRAGRLVDDQFWNGLPWTVGLREVKGASVAPTGQAFELQILPLPAKFGMYIEDANQLRFNSFGWADALLGVHVIPQYKLTVEAPKQ